MRHNPRLQHFVRAVYIINALILLPSLLYHTMIDLFLLSRSALSQPCLQHFVTMITLRTCTRGKVISLLSSLSLSIEK